MNILLTAIGSMSALCAINKLHEAGHKVVGCEYILGNGITKHLYVMYLSKHLMQIRKIIFLS